MINMTKTFPSTFTRTMMAATAAAFILAAGTVGAAAFQLKDETTDRPTFEMAYAEPDAGRFGPVELPAPGGQDFEHELNDSWLGMTVVSADGETLGYVIDAVVDAEGEITDLVIAPDIDSEGEVFVSARLAVLGENTVSLSLTSNDIAALETATETARSLF